MCLFVAVFFLAISTWIFQSHWTTKTIFFQPFPFGSFKQKQEQQRQIVDNIRAQVICLFEYCVSHMYFHLFHTHTMTYYDTPLLNDINLLLLYCKKWTNQVKKILSYRDLPVVWPVDDTHLEHTFYWPNK